MNITAIIKKIVAKIIEKVIQITHHTSTRFKENGYTRRHILFITHKLVRNLEQKVLECENCLYDVSNNQRLKEESYDEEKLLFSTRVLENTLLENINENKGKLCNDPKCIFSSIVNNDNQDDYDYSKYDYVFLQLVVIHHI